MFNKLVILLLIGFVAVSIDAEGLKCFRCNKDGCSDLPKECTKDDIVPGIPITSTQATLIRIFQKNFVVYSANKKNEGEDSEGQGNNESGEPPKTTEPPAKTTEEPPKTTEPPAKTTEEPPKTTEPPAKTTEEPPKTTEPPAKTTEEPPKTTKPPAKTTEEPPKTTEPPAKTTEDPSTPIKYYCYNIVTTDGTRLAGCTDTKECKEVSIEDEIKECKTCEEDGCNNSATSNMFALTTLIFILFTKIF